jgi:hypothetical protein
VFKLHAIFEHLNHVHMRGRTAAGRSHLRYQEAAAFKRQESVGDTGLRRAGREQKFRMARLRDVKEEDAVLSAQQAQEPAAGQDVVVGGEVAVMRLMPTLPGGGTGTVPITFP